MAMIRLRELTVAQRLTDISLTLESGQVMGVIGPNGSGKSTLLNAIAGLLPHTGTIHLGEQPVDQIPPRKRARMIGLLPQSARSAWSLRVEEVVSLGRLPWNDSDAIAIQTAMELTGITALKQRYIDQLSGGEKARVWLARVLAGQPQLLLADEPIANLDLHYQCDVLKVLHTYARRGHGVIIALHDLSLAARYCDRLCLLEQGSLAMLGEPAEVLEAQRLSSIYGTEIHVDLESFPPVILPR